MLTPGRKWLIAPAKHEPNRNFDRCWEYDRDRGVIAVGWDIGQPKDRDDLRVLWGSVWL